MKPKLITIHSSASLGGLGFIIILASFAKHLSLEAFYSLALFPSSMYFMRYLYASGFRGDKKAEFRNFIFHLATLMVSGAGVLIALRVIDAYKGSAGHAERIFAWLVLLPIYGGLLRFVKYEQSSTQHIFAFYTTAIYAMFALFMSRMELCGLYDSQSVCVMMDADNKLWDERSTTLVLSSNLMEYFFMLILFIMTFLVFGLINLIRRFEVPKLSHFKLSKWAQIFLGLHVFIIAVGHFSPKSMLGIFSRNVKKVSPIKPAVSNPNEVATPSTEVSVETPTPTPVPWSVEKIAELQVWFDQLGSRLPELSADTLEYANRTGSCMFESQGKTYAYFDYPYTTLNILGAPFMLKAIEGYKQDLNAKLGEGKWIRGFLSEQVKDFQIEMNCAEVKDAQNEYRGEEKCSVVATLNGKTKDLGDYTCVSGD